MHQDKEVDILVLWNLTSPLRCQNVEVGLVTWGTTLFYIPFTCLIIPPCGNYGCMPRSGNTLHYYQCTPSSFMYVYLQRFSLKRCGNSNDATDMGTRQRQFLCSKNCIAQSKSYFYQRSVLLTGFVSLTSMPLVLLEQDPRLKRYIITIFMFYQQGNLGTICPMDNLTSQFSNDTVKNNLQFTSSSSSSPLQFQYCCQCCHICCLSFQNVGQSIVVVLASVLYYQNCLPTPTFQSLRLLSQHSTQQVMICIIIEVIRT